MLNVKSLVLKNLNFYGNEVGNLKVDLGSLSTSYNNKIFSIPKALSYRYAVGIIIIIQVKFY